MSKTFIAMHNSKWYPALIRQNSVGPSVGMVWVVIWNYMLL